MLNWKIGDVTITRVVELEVPVPFVEGKSFLPQASPAALKTMPWLYPHFAQEDGTLTLSIHALLVEAPGIKLVVDTCIGNDKPRPLLRGQQLQTPFLKHMEEAGFGRNDVNVVVCTHLHVDHVGWNTMLENDEWVPTFPKARYLIGREEYEHWVGEDNDDQFQVLNDSVTPIFEAELAEMVEMDHRISPEIRLIPTAGHTPGHVSVVIESKSETAIITGDMMHHPCQIGRPNWSSEYDSNKIEAAKTRHAMIGEWAKEGALIIGTHFATPTAGRIVKDGNSYRLEV